MVSRCNITDIVWFGQISCFLRIRVDLCVAPAHHTVILLVGQLPAGGDVASHLQSSVLCVWDRLPARGDGVQVGVGRLLWVSGLQLS